MVKLTKDTLKGFCPAIVTPFTEKGEIMEDAFQDIVGWLIDCGAEGICIAGDNGESWTLDAGERARLTQIAVAKAAGRIPIIMGATAPGSAQTIKYGQAALEAGASGLLVMPQTYVLKASRPELLRRFEALAKAVDLPIVAYNSPRRSGIEMSLGDLEAIMGVAPIVGLKESHRDFFHHTHLLEKFRDRISIMVGPSHFIFPAIPLGAKGFIATSPELLGKTAGRITKLASEPMGPEHRAIHYKLTVLYQTLMSVGTWPSALKAALNLLGQPAGVPRDPVLPLSGSDLDTVKRALDQCGLL